MRILLILGAVTLLSSCAGQIDDQTCKSYGLSFGTPEYANCRQGLMAQRQSALQSMQQNNAALAQQQNQVLQNFQNSLNQSQQRSRPLDCTTTYFGGVANTHCQ